jgi:hypothetical protein
MCLFIFIFGIMQQPKIHLEFNCQKKWSEMTPQGNGRFCGDCKKVVTDFTKANNPILDTPQSDCGSFYAHQLDKPFNDWRDKVIALYQKTTLRLKNNKLLKPSFAFLLMILLVVSGCRSRLSGKFRTAKDTKRFGHTQETAVAKK